MTNTNYRKDIDGLRTIAVSSVILYHAQLYIGNGQLLAGGYLGVDIFFVISGFLITGILKTELENSGSISILNFYNRRLRRLAPALFFVFLCSIAVAYVLLTPESMVDFAKSMLASTSFVSNFYWDSTLQEYGAESGYFKPLLHTWSLAVEEQFYILFPLLLLGIYKLKRKPIFVIAIGILASFLTAIYVTADDQSQSFYMLYTRAWELLVGAILVFIPADKNLGMNVRLLRNIFGIAALSILVYSLLNIEYNASHPGGITALPVLATALLIHINKNENWTKTLLELKPLTLIGLISYSLYLWHFPIFAFGLIYDAQPDYIDKALWVLLTTLASIISYKYIEQPFRDKTRITNPNLYTITGITVALILAFCAYAILSNGIKSRLPLIIQNLEINVINSRACTNNEACNENAPATTKLISIGDSHMMPFERALLDIAQQRSLDFISMNERSCEYVLGLNRVHRKTQKISNCNNKYQQQRRNTLLSYSGSIIVIGSRLPVRLSETGFNNKEGGNEGRKSSVMQPHKKSLRTKSERIAAYKKSLKESVLELAEKGNKIILIYPIPEVGWNVAKKLMELYRTSESIPKFQEKLSNTPITTSYKVYLERTQDAHLLLDNIQHDNIFRVYPGRVFCNSKIPNRCITHDDKNSFYRDDDHLSGAGVDLLRPDLETAIDNALIRLER
ncbi:acyltransferase family protein [Simiduia aestuariiviva]|uniref:Peptidoglycan/LPS O-acetylase OafA/YrhL n=1 Tax=Simiduia aestuariiviva TaxID=1510459 RepID=A0A839US61_9GAMM|nr:acyltransferase family protein [Simiduia aestuariiviva]MBB3168358.1 peptidoglycan/LPS O-acetylase OafA/YrhL [Simiduia aestuariiviva]